MIPNKRFHQHPSFVGPLQVFVCSVLRHADRREAFSNRPIAGTRVIDMTSRVQRRPRLSGLLNFYRRVA
jgi:hypothetical protein